MVKPVKVRIKISKDRIDSELKDQDMVKAKGKIIEMDIRKKDTIKKI
jgi:hypothetical protein